MCGRRLATVSIYKEKAAKEHLPPQSVHLHAVAVSVHRLGLPKTSINLPHTSTSLRLITAFRCCLLSLMWYFVVRLSDDSCHQWINCLDEWC